MLVMETQSGDEHSSDRGCIKQALIAIDALAYLLGNAEARAEHDRARRAEQQRTERTLAFRGKKEKAVAGRDGGPGQRWPRRFGMRQCSHAARPARSISPRSDRWAATS